MKIVVATRNRHKLEEIRAVLGPAFDYGSLLDYPMVPSPEENAPSFAGNAALKASHLARWLSRDRERGQDTNQNLAVLADDSGLEVDVLNGAPGVYSARFAALDGQCPGNSSDAENNAKLLRLLEGIPAQKRTARFKCALAWQQLGRGDADIFEGSCEGRIGLVPAGGGGFGYDPLFYPEGEEKSFAQLGEEKKNQISHRARALEKLREHLHRSIELSG